MNASAASSCSVVVADYNRPLTVRKIAAMIPPDCSLHIIAKGRQGCQQHCRNPSTCSCETHQNLGDDAGAVMRYVWEHYDTLPETLVFMPSSEKWMRLSLLQSMLAERHVSNVFRCIPMYIWLPHLAKWMIDRYVHRSDSRQHVNNVGNLTLASPRQLGRWLRHHARFGSNDLAVPACGHLLFMTSRARLLERPRAMYARLTAELEKGVHTEAVHYVERAVGAIFAGKRRWWNVVCNGEPLCGSLVGERGVLGWRQNLSIGIPKTECAATRELQCRSPTSRASSETSAWRSCWC